MSYWRNDELESIKQTQTAIPSTNGLQYQGGDRMDFTIPPTVQLFDGKSSYLNFDIQLSGDTDTGNSTRLVLDGVCGGQILLKNVRIYGNNVLLEEISGYNVKVNVQYWYDADASLRSLRAIKEGCLIPTVNNRGDQGGSIPVMVDTVSCPYYIVKDQDPNIDDWDNDDDFLQTKLSLPLHTGIFADSFHAFPNFLFSNGLKIEIDLEDEGKVLKQLESVNRNRRVHMNPIYQSLIGGAGADWDADGTASDSVYLGFANNMNLVKNVPFVVGERVNFCTITNPLVSVAHLQKGGVYAQPIIDRIEVDNAVVPPRIKITFDDTYTNPAASPTDIVSGEACMYSAAIDTQTPAPSLHAATTNYDCDFTLSNAELVVQHIELSKSAQDSMISDMRNDGALELDIHTCTNYKHSTLANNRQLTINLPISNTKAKSMVIVPCDSTVYNDAQLVGGIGTYEIRKDFVRLDDTGVNMDIKSHSFQSGYSGIMDFLTSYQFNIDDKLVPSRPINVGDMNWGRTVQAQHLIEVEKALNQARIVPRSFRGFVDNFVIARAFALYDGVADLRNRTNQIQLAYEETTDTDDPRTPEKNKLFNCFVYHIRTITVKGESVSVQL